MQRADTERDRRRRSFCRAGRRRRGRAWAACRQSKLHDEHQGRETSRERTPPWVAMRAADKRGATQCHSGAVVVAKAQ
jgi:hypothetical protein